MNQKEKKYLDSIKAREPAMAIKNVVFDFLNGSHSDLVIIDGTTVFKFSKFDWCAVYLSNAVKTIQLLKNYVDITLPNVISLEPGVIRYDFIPGKPLYRNELLLDKSLEQDFLAKQLGVFLKQLHSIPLEEAKAHRIENHDLNTDAFDWESQYKEFQNKLFPFCDDYSKEYIEQVFQFARNKENFFTYTPTVIHANLDPRHIIYDSEAHHINAITGFGSSCIGDPALDIGALLSHLGESFVSRISEYDESIPEQIDRARFYAALQRLNRAKELADRIVTRDFSNFKICLAESDIMPIGKRL